VIDTKRIGNNSSKTFFFPPPEENGFGTFTLGSLNFWREVQMVVFHVFKLKGVGEWPSFVCLWP
jgi:hypothetical protein